MGKGKHHHHGGGFRGGFMPYPYPIQYPQSSEIFVVDKGPSQVCNPTPPLKPVPGTYKNAKGEYCWPTPAAGLGADDPQQQWIKIAKGATGVYLLKEGLQGKKGLLWTLFGGYLLYAAVK